MLDRLKAGLQLELRRASSLVAPRCRRKPGIAAVLPRNAVR